MVFPELLLNQQNLRLSLYPPPPLYKATRGLCIFLQGEGHTGRGSILECCVLPVATVTIFLPPGWALAMLGFVGSHRGEDLVAPIRRRA